MDFVGVRMTAGAALLTLMTTFTARGAFAGSAAIGQDAIWTPSAAQETRLADACVAHAVPDVRVCLLRFMAEAGASSAALELTRALGDEGWLTAYTPRGRVSVAVVRRPFRASVDAGILLVNGDPALIDVSESGPLAALTSDARLAAIVKDHPDASLWADDPAQPDVTARPGGGQRFLFDFPLRSCRACADLAVAGVAFDFNGDGRFLGPRLLTVRAPAIFFIEGTVRRGKAFEARIDGLRVVRLHPFSEGWTLEVQDKDGKDYCSVVTPPYRGTNALMIFGGSPGDIRKFRCVKRRTDQEAAEKSLREVLWNDKASWKETDAAVQAHERIASAAERGTLTITHLELGNQGEGKRPWIEAMNFRFELRPRGPAER